MEVVPVERPPGAFQQPLSPAEIAAVCRRGLGEQVRVLRAVELGLGTFNTTYRLELAGRPPVVLRVAPERARQPRSSRDGLRNEHAAEPYLARLGSLVPTTLAADFSHEVVPRDLLIQTLLVGVPAPEGLARHPRPRWAAFYAQLGDITRQIHDVEGTTFGPVAGPHHPTWGDALINDHLDAAAELAEQGREPDEVHRLVEVADADRPLLDAVQPRLLHGDLWHVNLLVDPDAPEPTITGLCDSDRASWGDPLADWTIERARQRPGTERDAFWTTYGPLPQDRGSRRRALHGRARNVLGARLDIHRRGLDLTAIPREHWDLGPVLAALGDR